MRIYLRNRFCLFLDALLVAGSLTACAAYPGIGGTKHWEEEVRLHDGRSLIVERSQTTDTLGAREIGQKPPLSEETLRFKTPDGRQVTWRSDFGRGYEDNLSPLVLDIIDDTPYLLTYPTRCHAYNKWGRPNPPYVYFRHDGKAWQLIPLSEVPAVMIEANLLIGGLFSREKHLTNADRRAPYLPAEGIRRANRQMGTDTTYLRQIVREPMTGWLVGCEEQVFYKGTWVGPGDSIGKRVMDRISK